MNKYIFHRYCWLISVLILILTATACSEEKIYIPEEPDPDETEKPTEPEPEPEPEKPEEPTEPEFVENVIEQTIKEWNISKDDVVTKMKGYTQIESQNPNILLFKTSHDKQQISYHLFNGQLSATAIVMPTAMADTLIKAFLKGYEYTGELKGARIYEDLSTNTMATTWNTLEEDSTMAAIGFAPIKSETYEEVTPIEVVTNDNVTPHMISAELAGSVSGVDSPVECGFIYGTTEGLSEIAGNKIKTTASGTFSLSVKGLIDDMTYYYCAYAVIDEMYYLGEVKKFTTEPLSYKINGKSFKMVKVESETMPAFSIMQTELPPNSDIEIAGIHFDKVNSNMDEAVIKVEFRNFIERVREETGLPFRSPTTDEWKYAARGGKNSAGYKYSGSNSIDDVAWYQSNSNKGPQDIALKNQNELGLYDMSGNFAELCNDTEHVPYVDGNFCGGSWRDSPYYCTVNSVKQGIDSGKIPGTNYKEKNAFDARYIGIRLVYSRIENKTPDIE